MHQSLALVVCLLVPAGSVLAADCRFENGNLNGDELLDIGDVVFGLMYLFQAGPAPAPQFVADEECAATLLEELTDTKAELYATKAALAESQAEVEELRAALARRRLPATGQTKCYNASGVEVPCNSATCPGQDGFYRSGCPSEGRFVDNLDRTVTDNCTGLMWQKDTADTNVDGMIDGGDGLDWCDALSYCENLSFAGHSDWRLPNVRELQSIVDYGRINQLIDPALGTLSAVYWSSSTFVDNSSVAWGVSFYIGVVVNGDGKDRYNFVRAVRGGGL